jgi:SAM-dependent methyltransferase
MTIRNLGLPLEYKKLPQYFDAWNINDDTHTKNSIIEQLLKKYDVKTVLDLTCGTGSQVFFLLEHGYHVVGADFSPELLKIARKRARTHNLKVDFIDGDMRTLRVGQFDAVISIFNAVGHLSKAGFSKAIKNAAHNLKNGGIFIFDILNLEAMTDKVVAELACYVHKKINTTQILSTQCSTIDRANGILTSYDSYMIQKNIDKPEIFSNKFSLQIYSAKELNDILAQNGFATLGQYTLDGSKFQQLKSLNILTVAKKISKS